MSDFILSQQSEPQFLLNLWASKMIQPGHISVRSRCQQVPPYVCFGGVVELCNRLWLVVRPRNERKGSVVMRRWNVPNIYHTHARTYTHTHTHAYTLFHARTHTHTHYRITTRKSTYLLIFKSRFDFVSQSITAKICVSENVAKHTFANPNLKHFLYFFTLSAWKVCHVESVEKFKTPAWLCYRLQERTKSETKKFVDSTTNLCSNRNISCQMSLISSFVIVLSLFQSVCLFVGRSVCLQLENVRALKIRNCLVLSD